MDGFEEHEHEANCEEVVDRDRDHTTARFSFTQLKKADDSLFNFGFILGTHGGQHLLSLLITIIMTEPVRLPIHTWCTWWAACRYAPPEGRAGN